MRVSSVLVLIPPRPLPEKLTAQFTHLDETQSNVGTLLFLSTHNINITTEVKCITAHWQGWAIWPSRPQMIRRSEREASVCQK